MFREQGEQVVEERGGRRVLPRHDALECVQRDECVAEGRLEDGINLFDPGNPNAKPAIVYTHSAIDPSTQAPIRLFSSIWRYHDTATFLAKYSDSQLDRLEDDRGLHIAHTYLDSFSQAEGHRGKSLLEKSGDIYRLRPEVASWMVGLGKRQKAGRLWVPGVAALADHLVAMSEVRIDPVDSGMRIRSGRPVHGASFLIPRRLVSPKLDGGHLPRSQVRKGKDGTVFWFDMLAGGDHLVTWEEPPQ